MKTCAVLCFHFFPIFNHSKKQLKFELQVCDRLVINFWARASMRYERMSEVNSNIYKTMVRMAMPTKFEPILNSLKEND